MLGGIAYALVFMLAIALALFCARFEDTFMDRFVCRIGTVAFYVPAFWMGVVLVLVFSVNLKLLPSSGAYGIGKSGDMADRLAPPRPAAHRHGGEPPVVLRLHDPQQAAG